MNFKISISPSFHHKNTAFVSKERNMKSEEPWEFVGQHGNKACLSSTPEPQDTDVANDDKDAMDNSAYPDIKQCEVNGNAADVSKVMIDMIHFILH